VLGAFARMASENVKEGTMGSRRRVVVLVLLSVTALREAIALTGGGTVAIASTVELRCTASNTSGNFINAGLTAIKVASLN
jgi:hypothetical protein